MNINKKTLILAIAAGMGIIPVAGVFAAAPAPLGKAPGAAVDTIKPRYSPAEAKESGTAYGNVIDDYANLSATGTIATATTTAASLLAGGDLNVYVYTIPGYTVKASETKSLQVKVSLTGGAKFVKAPSLICLHSGATTPAVLSTFNWADVEGSTNPMPATTKPYELSTTNSLAGASTYNFYFPEGFAIPNIDSGACILSLSAAPHPIAVDGLAIGNGITLATPGVDVGLNVEVTYDDFFLKVTRKDATIPLISFVTAYKATFTNKNIAGTTAAAAVIDVGTLSKKFTSGSLQALGGSVIVEHVDKMRTLRNASGFALSATDIISSASITVSGPTVATLSKVTFNSPGGKSCAAGDIIGAAPATVSGRAADSITVQVTGGTTTDSYKSLVSGVVADHTGLLVCLIAEGNTKVMQDGYVTLTVNAVTPAGKVVELGSSSADFLKVKRNGVAVRVLNVPGADAKTDPYRVNIRMYNTSNQEVKDVAGILYGVDGKVIADKVVLAASMPPNTVKLITSDNLISLVGKGWTGRAWMLIQAPVDASLFKVQVLIKQPSGVLANISTDAAD